MREIDPFSTLCTPHSVPKGGSMKKISILTVMLLFAAAAVQAAVVAYSLPVPGVV